MVQPSKRSCQDIRWQALEIRSDSTRHRSREYDTGGVGRAICCLVTWTLPIVQRRRFDSFEHTQRKVPPSKGECRLHGSPSTVIMPGNPPQPLPGGVYV